VLPDFFNLPTCSVYGSHNTTWMRGAPHVRLGLPAFGPDDLAPGEFHPLASSYLEPLIVLAIPGMLLWMLLGSSLMCFCYRRYHLGLCGAPRRLTLTLSLALALPLALTLAPALALALPLTRYADTRHPHYLKNAFDAGEDGLGRNAHSIDPERCDCAPGASASFADA